MGATCFAEVQVPRDGQRPLRTDLVIVSSEDFSDILACEFDGPHHFGAHNWNRRGSDADAEWDGAGDFERQKVRDRFKDAYWRTRGVSTLHVHHEDYGRAGDVVLEALRIIQDRAKREGFAGIPSHFMTKPDKYRAAAVAPSEWIDASISL
jgi:hypothetical protein